jgi:hypothetical protein
MARRDPYLAAAEKLVALSGVRVRKYRSSMTGVAFTRADDWGIEAPRPHGPVSFAVFAHEVAHHLLHRSGSRPRWLEEVEAWEYALDCFERFELRGVDHARADAARSIRYAVAKALRRGSPETARAILERTPEWAWRFDDAREAVVAAHGLEDLRKRAGQ